MKFIPGVFTLFSVSSKYKHEGAEINIFWDRHQFFCLPIKAIFNYVCIKQFLETQVSEGVQIETITPSILRRDLQKVVLKRRPTYNTSVLLFKACAAVIKRAAESLCNNIR